MPGVRHLHPSQVESALRRSGQIDQFLGLGSRDLTSGVVRWVSVSRVRDELELRLHEVEDVGSSDYADMASFPSADPDDEFGEGRLIASAADFSAILDAAFALGAVVDRWVNQGVIDDEYLAARWGVA